MKFEQFITLEAIEQTSYKHLYVDICGSDLIAGILLSRIVYWFGSSKRNGEIRTRILHNEKRCIVKKRCDWYDECRITDRQFDRAIKILKEKDLISVEIHKSPLHNYDTACFIFLNEEVLMQAVNDHVDNHAEKTRKEDESFENEQLNVAPSEINRVETQSYAKCNSGVTQSVTPSIDSTMSNNNVLCQHSQTLASLASEVTDFSKKDKPKKAAKEQIDPVHLELAKCLYLVLLFLNPKLTKPNLDKWAHDMGVMMRTDGRTEEEIRRVIDYVKLDHLTATGAFRWSCAVQSPDKLRKHFAAIWDKMTTKKSVLSNAEIAKSVADEVNRKSRAVKMECYGKYCELQYHHHVVGVLNYDSHGFLDQLRNLLQKANIEPKSFESKVFE